MTVNVGQPSLFGLNKTNRDYSKEATWGKNQFNSSFPASLCCYLASKDIEANYLSINSGEFKPTTIKIKDIFGLETDDSDLYFAFEAQHTPFQKYVIGTLPRTDLVTQRESNGECLQGLEIKLTALPDNSTFNLNESEYGSELVVRPDTIVYLACSLATSLQANLTELIPYIEIDDWADASLVLPHITTIIETIQNISLSVEEKQTAFLLQPIWKTKGKSPQLAEQCLDIFVWSNAGFTNFISQIADSNPKVTKITRQTRTAIWLFKMLQDIAIKGKFDHEAIIDNLSYNTKNDKAFASSGKITNKYMLSPRLEKPIISKAEIKNIILGGGQNMLSPERRFDAIIFNSPELFL
jgi:type II restriction enzyme